MPPVAIAMLVVFALFMLVFIGLAGFVLIHIMRAPTCLDVPAAVGSYDFEIDKDGYYAIWIRGKLFSAPAHKKHTRQIIARNRQTLQPKKYWTRWTRNSFTHGQMALEYIYLPKGRYQLVITDKAPKTTKKPAQPSSHTLPSTPADQLPENKDDRYYLKPAIAESHALIGFILLMSIPMLLLKLIRCWA